MRIILVSIFLCLVVSVCFSQTRLIQVVNNSTGEGVPFCRVSYLPMGGFVIADSVGNVELSYMDNNVESVLISGFSINDTVISVNKLLDSRQIKLKVNDVLLETFEIANRRLATFVVGDSGVFVLEEPRSRKLASFDNSGSLQLSDMRYGSIVYLPKREERYLAKLFFHVGSSFVDESMLLSIRVLISDERTNIRPMKIFSLSSFQDLAAKEVLIRISRTGWNEVVFDPPLSIPSSLDSILILLDQWQESDSFTISRQRYANTKIKSLFFAPPNNAWVASLPDKSFAAIMVEMLVD